jgi:hypothetical protein
MTSGQWISLITALGVGSVVAAILSRWSVISNLRQNWINALRDDLATYLTEIDAMHFRLRRLYDGPATTDDLEKQQETRNAALLVYRRILLRLNTEEVEHVALAESLKNLLTIKTTAVDTRGIDVAITTARRLLKQEWNVTKYGIFARSGSRPRR